ncbi:hypothetical protein ARMGADRAFT_1062610 [Armillaria gallica]|uniref:Uncharacterized protein n=1 Tax=Armillaria gallica TaxID=47427 RepID=A0A2H3E1R5_ARMGA|nr:hypothetical protein ARMGADRAFT_1062610 [Armillaria gallica]
MSRYYKELAAPYIPNSMVACAFKGLKAPLIITGYYNAGKRLSGYCDENFAGPRITSTLRRNVMVKDSSLIMLTGQAQMRIRNGEFYARRVLRIFPSRRASSLRNAESHPRPIAYASWRELKPALWHYTIVWPMGATGRIWSLISRFEE